MFLTISLRMVCILSSSKIAPSFRVQRSRRLELSKIAGTALRGGNLQPTVVRSPEWSNTCMAEVRTIVVGTRMTSEFRSFVPLDFAASVLTTPPGSCHQHVVLTVNKASTKATKAGYSISQRALTTRAVNFRKSRKSCSMYLRSNSEIGRSLCQHPAGEWHNGS